MQPVPSMKDLPPCWQQSVTVLAYIVMVASRAIINLSELKIALVKLLHKQLTSSYCCTNALFIYALFLFTLCQEYTW